MIEPVSGPTGDPREQEPFKLGYYRQPLIGCICPPGANIQCQRADCPRKGLK